MLAVVFLLRSQLGRSLGSKIGVAVPPIPGRGLSRTPGSVPESGRAVNPVPLLPGCCPPLPLTPKPPWTLCGALALELSAVSQLF